MTGQDWVFLLAWALFLGVSLVRAKFRLTFLPRALRIFAASLLWPPIYHLYYLWPRGLELNPLSILVSICWAVCAVALAVIANGFPGKVSDS